jgi:hypothetical protein
MVLEPGKVEFVLDKLFEITYKQAKLPVEAGVDQRALKRVREVIKEYQPDGAILGNSADPLALPKEYWRYLDARAPRSVDYQVRSGS